jgi:membrane protein YqaA with SNARE-associated domain
MTELYNYGYAGLFAAGFLSATFIPLSSEAVLSLLILTGYNLKVCIIVASVGNWLGGMSGYFLGYIGKWEWIEKYLRVKNENIIKVQALVNKYGVIAALLCWLPGIGDFIAIALGFMRSNMVLVAISMFIGKLGRYFVWGYLTFSFK